MPATTRTNALLADVIGPRVIADLIESYLLRAGRGASDAAITGHYELAMTGDRDNVIVAACRGGHDAIAAAMLAVGGRVAGSSRPTMNSALVAAVQASSIECAQLAINNGACELDTALLRAVERYDYEMADFLVAHGAHGSKLSSRVPHECKAGNIPAIERLIHYGVRGGFEEGLGAACYAAQHDAMALMVKCGADRCLNCPMAASKHLDRARYNTRFATAAMDVLQLGVPDREDPIPRDGVYADALGRLAAAEKTEKKGR